MSEDSLRVVQSETPPTGGCRKTGDFLPPLTLIGEHDLCPGCGEPVALRQILDSIESLGPRVRSRPQCWMRVVGKLASEITPQWAPPSRRPNVVWGCSSISLT